MEIGETIREVDVEVVPDPQEVPAPESPERVEEDELVPA